jgi:hypothetical protein
MKYKESRVVMTDPQHKVLTEAAKDAGMPLATYLRVCALNDANKQGNSLQQTKPEDNDGDG